MILMAVRKFNLRFGEVLQIDG
ncbi:hypothetical protein BN1263120019 [Stenotrophomonas thermophila]|nr:hypothetical protein BN1263120019 [Stenotrophomonas maltophilia]